MIDAILDTSVLIDLLRGFRPATDWFASLGRQRAAITPVVWMETVQGATNRGTSPSDRGFLNSKKEPRGYKD